MATCCRDVRGLGGPGTGVLRGEMVPLGVSIEERCKRRESGIESLLYAAGVHSSSQAGKKKMDRLRTGSVTVSLNEAREPVLLLMPMFYDTNFWTFWLTGKNHLSFDKR